METDDAATPRLPHLKVQVWIDRQGRNGELEVLLLLLRPERGGYWQPVTGGVDAGELPEAAALREAREESGLDFGGERPASLEYRFAFQARGREQEEHVFALRARADGAPIRLDAREHVDGRWVSPGEAFTLLRHPSNAEGLRRLLLLRRPR